MTTVLDPPGTVFDADGWPQSWSAEFGCFMHSVLWNQLTGEPITSLQPKQFELLKMTPLMRSRWDVCEVCKNKYVRTNPNGRWTPEHCPTCVPGGVAEPIPTRIGFGGAAGGSKSRTARALAIIAAHLWPGSSTCIVRLTEQQLKDNHVTPFMREVPRDLYDINLSDLEVRWTKTKSLTHFRYLRHEKDLDNFQGPSWDLVILEESTQIPWELISWVIGNRNRATVDGTYPFAVFPSNPGGRSHHHYKRLFIDRRFNADAAEKPEDYAFLKAKLSDNFVLMKRDPGYIRKLDQLAEPYRSWQRDGDFEAGAGAALPQLNRSRHIVPFFVPPAHWRMFGGFDWGYEHPFSFGVYAVNEDGRVFKCDTITSRGLQPVAIAQRITEAMQARGLDPKRLNYVAAGHDCWADHKARGEHGPTIAERMIEHGFGLIRANISRVTGLNNLREYLDWEGRGGFDDAGLPLHDDPALVFMRTPGNEKCFECMEMAVPDPDFVEDVLKTNADQFGEGGDDLLEETRYALSSRPPRAPSLIKDKFVNAWSKAALEYEMKQGRIVRHEPVVNRDDVGFLHPDFGQL